MLLGGNNSGKLSAGNTILGRRAFEDNFSIQSFSRECEKHEGTVEGREISVINTPALFKTSLTAEELKAGLDQCISLSVPGPHAFLLVIRLGDFTHKEKNTLRWIEKNFSKEALKFSMVLLMNGLQGVSSVEEHLKRNEALQKLVNKCKGGFHVFKNDGHVQVSELLEKIERMIQKNGGHYSNETYRRKVRREEERRRREGRQGQIVDEIVTVTGSFLRTLVVTFFRTLCSVIAEVFVSILKGFGAGVIIIAILSLTGIFTKSWTCFCLKILIFWSGGIVGAVIGWNSVQQMHETPLVNTWSR